MTKPIDVTIVGGGMITLDLLLPSVYHMQRTGLVSTINICALDSGPLKALKEDPGIVQAFPGQDFVAHPPTNEDPKTKFPTLYKEVLARMAPRQAVVVAMPDQFHYEVVMEALKNNQHVLCVKPLVLKYKQAVEVEELAYQKGLFVGIEYHKRFDRRALVARRHYELGHFGEFVMGEAKMIEPYYYRSSNFQNWFTCDKTDPFVYVGCHYVDLVQFITRLRPSEISVSGVKGRFPNGNEGYMWANGRVIYENGAILSVIDGLGYPDDGAGSNDQCLVMYCEGKNGKNGLIAHDDQFRGVEHSYLTSGIGCAGSIFNYINPDFFRFVPWEGAGYKPAGYGVDSVAAILGMAHRIENDVAGLSEAESLAKRRKILQEADEKAIIATPKNSGTNELVVEAARLSILNEGRMARIVYGQDPHVELK
ncbi:MAG: Gfo/Idh/MocA family oxidoreductase [Verrucomicrobia bacterium]|nr:Gfo/Idh/MocA family oxidoreductase [Verrucomicrobiota bacterium]